MLGLLGLIRRASGECGVFKVPGPQSISPNDPSAQTATTGLTTSFKLRKRPAEDDKVPSVVQLIQLRSRERTLHRDRGTQAARGPACHSLWCTESRAPRGPLPSCPQPSRSYRLPVHHGWRWRTGVHGSAQRLQRLHGCTWQRRAGLATPWPPLALECR